MMNVEKFTAKQLIEYQSNNRNFQLISIGSDTSIIPDSFPHIQTSYIELEGDISIIRKDIPVVIACDKGVNSYFLAILLMQKYDMNNIYCLEGGFENLNKEINNK